MKEDENIDAQLQSVDEITNALEGLGELVNTKNCCPKDPQNLAGKIQHKGFCNIVQI